MGSPDSTFMEYDPEFENFEFEDSEFEDETELYEEEEVFTEAELMELAGELLNVNSEAELDQFLGKVIKKTGRKFGSIVRSPIGRVVGGRLKGLLKRGLSMAGGALGDFAGGPLGSMIGKCLASYAGGRLGLEAETLNAEDQEFEGAKHLVRMAGSAVKSALMVPRGVNPSSAVQQAVGAALARYAPGLMTGSPMNAPPRQRGKSGRWVRQGRNIVLLNY
jgi:hypothetical protein